MEVDYGKLRKYLPGDSCRFSQPEVAGTERSPARNSRRRTIIFFIFAAFFLIVSAVSAAVFLALRNSAGSEKQKSIADRKPTQAISRTCGRTRFHTLCVKSLLDFPDSAGATESALVHISVNLTHQRFDRALYSASEFSVTEMTPIERSAYEACLELLEDSVGALEKSLNSAASPGRVSSQDVMTWLSAALTNQDTCADGFAGISSSSLKDSMEERLRDLYELASNSLAIFAASSADYVSEEPIQNKRRLMSDLSDQSSEFPKWLSRRERRLLGLPVSAIQADIIVSKDGNGTVKTIREAIKKVPEHSVRRTIIYVRAGRYEEKNLKVGRKKTNVMFIGDGKAETVISGGRSIFDNVTTFHTASFAATGEGFMARDMAFENWAGPSRHQAVALRVGADHAVVYHCNIIGYQDTLYVHSQRQFFRECDIYGTVDFIFGNAAVVFQNCSIYTRKPLPLQKNTITAQNRKDPNQITGISIHNCRILPTPGLALAKANFSTYLGRPWKLYSRVVYMLSYMDDHVHPNGWLEWNATFALDTLYYGEYMNYGPGGAIGQRVKWPGYRVITSAIEASRFTVRQFIFGSSWLPNTGVAFIADLSV